jgi:hypothetical protein
LVNFGGFATAERKVIFDLNDRRSPIAPWEWMLTPDRQLVVAGLARFARLIAGSCLAGCRSYRGAWRNMQRAGYPGLERCHDFNTIIESIADKTKRFYSRARPAHCEERTRKGVCQ